MMNRIKILRPATIIPQALYVEREADRQLRAVIQGMGRPGYVLVARQMGKTNMLLHARHELEDANHLFAYADFSLPGESLREQLRAIVDAFLNTHKEQFKDVAHQITAARERGSLPAHKEHENELRALLEATTGTIVLIFDEIDALINTTYSDQLFSLIRSIYFSRANFPEYERLTYVLSGVAEPRELIKNKNISPFNIGEKIYLDEFTTEELRTFLRNARLDLEPEIVDRVYFWTEGNPRMTWDVCSALEDTLLAQRPVDPNIVDTVVHNLYFNTFDRAPIDHIRTMVANERDIRAAISRIRTGDGEIGDQMRAKLYLAGIIASNFTSAFPRLKNRVIDTALSEAWLQDIEKQKRNVLERARERMSNKQYKEALPLFIEHLTGLSSRDDKALIYYEVGVCHFEEAQYQAAREWFEKQPIDRHESLSAHLHEMYLLAICYTYLDMYYEAISYFQTVIDAARHDTDFFFARVNQAAARILAGGAANLNLAKNALVEILADTKQGMAGMPEDDAGKIITSTRVNLSQAIAASGDINGAIFHLDTAVDECMPHEKANLLTRLISLETDGQRRTKRVSDAMEFVSAYKPVVAARTASNPFAFDHSSMVELCAYVLSLSDAERKRSFLTYVQNQYFDDEHAYGTFFVDVIVTAYAAGHREPAQIECLNYLRNVGKTVSADVRATVMKIAAFGNDRKEFESVRAEYLSLMRQRPYPKLDHIDLRIMVDEIGKLLTARHFDRALAVVNTVNMYKAEASGEILSNYVLVDYFEMLASEYTGKIAKARDLAIPLSELDVEEYKEKASLLFSAEDIGVITNYARRILRGYSASPPVQNPYGHIGRNDVVTVKYEDGRIASDKFKRLKGDIEKGGCRIVSRAESHGH